jgi:hypothetical protein
MSGAIAAVIAIVLIGAVVAAGVLNTRTTQTVTTPSGSGTLALLMTDPPTVPNGTSGVYITYNDLAIHLSSAGNNSGWHLLDVSGQIDLMNIINVSQTIASVKVQNGVFNALEFNITSSTVTFDGANYSAYLVYREHTLFVPIAGGISIVNGQTSAAVIDLTPTVLLLGDPSSPTFAFIPAARGFSIPAQSISQTRVGETIDVHNQTWYKYNQPKFEISQAALTPTSLSITVTNTGNVSLDFTLAAVTSAISSSGGFKALPAVASISEFFVVYPNTTLVPIKTSNDLTLAQMISGAGYRLPPAASVTFKYSGPVTIGIVQAKAAQPIQQIIPGNRYLITITSSDKLAQTLVIASSTTTG